MKHVIEKTTISLTLGLSLVLLLLWTLSHTTPPAAHATALTPDRAENARSSLLQASVVLTVCPAMAGTCPFTNVQAAVDAANDGDVIKVASGIYTGVQPRPAAPGYAGPSIITQVVYISKTVTVQGGYTVTNWTTPDPQANPTTLDAQGDGRVLYVAAGISPTIEGLRITGGNADGLEGSPYGDSGGGIYVITATATISDCWIYSNTVTAEGGGLLLWGSDATLNANIIFANTAYGGGGVFIIESDATLNENTISGNIAEAVGGGLFVIFSDATLSRNAILSNASDNEGGGLSIWNSDATFKRDTVISNTALNNGGGFNLFVSTAKLVNNVIADNRAGAEGGGIHVEDTSLDSLHTTIARNSTSGIYITSGSIVLTNTILVSHSVGVYNHGGTARLESTLWYSNTSNWSGERTVNHSNDYNGDPAFVNPDAGNYHVGPPSVAVDQGVNAGVTDDIDGNPRPLGDGYDIGADETGVIVTKRATPNPARPGVRLTYTIQITNVSDVPLSATITDTLPLSVVLLETSGGTLMLPGGTPGATQTVGITWTALITENGVWTEQVVVSTAMDYVGPLSNVVNVTTDQGATGTAVCVSTVNATVYLPLVMRGWPPIPYPPTLYPIDNADSDNCYVVSWTGQTIHLPITYTLQEATDAAFTTGLREVCVTTRPSCTVSGTMPGTYYYHVRGQNAWGYGPWSNVQVATAGCPTTSTNQYVAGTAYQYDQDDPVRPAYNHADKNLALRSYTPNTDPGLQRELVNYGSDDPTQPPQLAALFSPYRVPTLSTFYRIYNWNWAPSPEPGTRGSPITDWPVTALGMQTTPGETLHTPTSGYDIGGGMEVIVLFADEDTVALKYTRQDSAGAPGYTVHVDNICTDPNLLVLYDQLDDPDGPRYVFPNASYEMPTLYDGQPLGTARGTEIVVAIVDSGAFMDTRSCNEWWQIRPGYTGTCPSPQ